MNATTACLPSVPAGFQWTIKTKRQWKYLCLRRKTWYGWKTEARVSVNPAGLGMQYALVSGAEEIIKHHGRCYGF